MALMYKVNNDVNPERVRTFFDKKYVLDYLHKEGAYNGIMGWRRPLRDGEVRKVSNKCTEGFTFYTIRDEHGWCVTI